MCKFLRAGGLSLFHLSSDFLKFILRCYLFSCELLSKDQTELTEEANRVTVSVETAIWNGASVSIY